MLKDSWERLASAALLLGTWARRDFRVRYSQTLLGSVWAVAQPMGVTVAFVFLLSRVSSNDPAPGVPAASFVFPGMLCWLLFAGGVNGAVQALTASLPIVAKVRFPRIVAPISGSLLPLVDFALAGVFLPLLLIQQDSGHRPQLLSLVIAVLGTLAFSMGVGCFASAFAVFLRDLRNAMPFLLQLLLLASPVIYPADSLPDVLRWSPMVTFISLFRSAVVHTLEPSHVEVFRACAISGLVLVLGFLYFRSVEDRFADVA